MLGRVQGKRIPVNSLHYNMLLRSWSLQAAKKINPGFSLKSSLVLNQDHKSTMGKLMMAKRKKNVLMSSNGPQVHSSQDWFFPPQPSALHLSAKAFRVPKIHITNMIYFIPLCGTINYSDFYQARKVSFFFFLMEIAVAGGAWSYPDHSKSCGEPQGWVAVPCQRKAKLVAVMPLEFCARSCEARGISILESVMFQHSWMQGPWLGS